MTGNVTSHLCSSSYPKSRGKLLLISVDNAAQKVIGNNFDCASIIIMYI